jgi:Lrp/AsnC family transcriptional regulator for asnA, asnC and gidA
MAIKRDREGTVKIDQTDLAIADLLKDDGRMTNESIAEVLDVSEGTVRNRIKKMVEAKFLKFTALTNPNMRRDKIYIFIFIILRSTDRWVQVAEEIMQLENVETVTMITGRYNLIIEVYIEQEKLLGFLTSELVKVDGIATTETHRTIRTLRNWL